MRPESAAAQRFARPELAFATEPFDAGSDIDLYVYATTLIPLAARARLASRRSDAVEIGNEYWEPGDEWRETETGIVVDITHRSRHWTDEVVKRLLHEHQAAIGYSTSVLHNLVTSTLLVDKTGWYAEVRTMVDSGYPDELAQAIVTLNYPLLRDACSSFGLQLLRASARDDGVAVQHRCAAYLASYFDILFALNRKLHPGEKRIAEAAMMLPLRGKALGAQLEQLLCPRFVKRSGVELIDTMVDDLTQLISAAGLRTSR